MEFSLDIWRFAIASTLVAVAGSNWQILVGFGFNSSEHLEGQLSLDYYLENDYDSKTKLSIIFSNLTLRLPNGQPASFEILQQTWKQPLG